MGVITEEQHKMLTRHLAALYDDATSFDITANHFRPEFERSLVEKSAPSIERAFQLRALVIDNEANAKYNRRLAETISALMPGWTFNPEHKWTLK